MKILNDSFNNREQIIKYAEVLSEPINVISGVMQGGVLSPTLFNIYLSDLNNYVKSHLYNFADDMTVLRVIYSETDCQILQNDLNSISKYCYENSLRLNVKKCEFLSISLKMNEQKKYTINGNEINCVSNHNNVGVIYDSTMSFNLHINHIKTKSIKKFYALRYLCKRCDGKTFLKLFQAYIWPILEYSNLCLVYNDSQNIFLEKIQKRITKFICNK